MLKNHRSKRSHVYHLFFSIIVIVSATIFFKNMCMAERPWGRSSAIDTENIFYLPENFSHLSVSEKLNFIKNNIVYIENKYSKLSLLIEQRQKVAFDAETQLMRIRDNFFRDIDTNSRQINESLIFQSNVIFIIFLVLTFALPAIAIYCCIKSDCIKKDIKKSQEIIVALKKKIENDCKLSTEYKLKIGAIERELEKC